MDSDKFIRVGGAIILGLMIIAGIFYWAKFHNQPDPAADLPKSNPIEQLESQTKSINLEEINPDYKFMATMPNEWQVENIEAIDSINIYNPNSPAATNLNKSQIFIRQFTANEFLTLTTVNVLSREESEVDNHRAVTYEIEKKSGVADFPNQPSWRNSKHKLVDVRFSNDNPSVFYVISYNPALPDADFQKFIDSLKFKNSVQQETQPALMEPISNANSRITLKPFGLYVTPQNSPVSPEKFSGYHSGTDFETTTAEANKVVEIKALCTGQLLQKRTASGYGGLVVQECKINNQRVTVLYGHIALSSVKQDSGDIISAGQIFAQLGEQGADTDNERKHLHLGIYKGDGIDIKGYVPTEAALNDWIDYKSLAI